MNSRARWARILKENGYTIESIATMDDSSFHDITNYLCQLGVEPDPEPWLDFIRFTDISLKESRKRVQYSFNYSSQNSQNNQTSEIMRDQDLLYQEAVNKMQELEEKTKQAEEREKKKAQKEMEKKKKELELSKKIILKKARQIPTDDQINGESCTVAVILPGGRQITKCFAITDKIENISNWVACFEEMFDENSFSPKVTKSDSDKSKEKSTTFLQDFENKIDELGMPIPFSLIKAPNEILDNNKTLAESRLIRRVLLNAVLDD